MPPRSVTIGFLWRFALAYAVLVLPWPGLKSAYERYFCAFGQVVFGGEQSGRITQFSASPVAAKTDLDTHITLANRGLLDVRGVGPARILGLDSRGVGWMPTAMIVALIVATPVPRARRVWSVLWGLGLIHGYLVVCLAVYIWNNSDAASGLSLVNITPFWKPVASGLQETLITQMGPSFAVPVILWILIIFRRQDFKNIVALVY